MFRWTIIFTILITKRSIHRVKRKYRSRTDQKIVSSALRLHLEWGWAPKSFFYKGEVSFDWPVDFGGGDCSSWCGILRLHRRSGAFHNVSLSVTQRMSYNTVTLSMQVSVYLIVGKLFHSHLNIVMLSCVDCCRIWG